MFGDNMVSNAENRSFLGLGQGRGIGSGWRWQVIAATAVAGPDGRWQGELEAPAPGGPYTVKITGPEQAVVLHEVWWVTYGCAAAVHMETGPGPGRRNGGG